MLTDNLLNAHEELQNKPPEEQVKEFWERCEFQHVPDKYCADCGRREGEYWIKEGIGRRIYRLELLEMFGLNNLFKYAVPFYIRYYEDKGMHTAEAWSRLFSEWLQWMTTKIGNDPTLALFWVLREVLCKKK